MPEETPPHPRKHRVIHWNPDAGKAAAPKRWTWWRILAVTVGGFFGVLIAAGLAIRAVRLVQPGFLRPDLPAAAGSPAALAAAAAKDPNAAFVSQSKAELARETATKALVELRRLPHDHPRQLEKLVLIEKEFLHGKNLLDARDFAAAFTHYDSLNHDIDEFARSVKMKGEAQLAYDSILTRIKELEIARSLAPAALEAAFIDAGTGRKFLDEGSFLAAKKAFDRGFAQLKKAETALSGHIDASLVRGQQAIIAGQSETATAAFKTALEKSPGNELALQGLKRAENANRVHALLLQAAGFEKELKYVQAAETYDKAFGLDAFSAVAQQGKARAARLEKETKFDTAFTAAQAAMKRKDWLVAITESEAALKVYPKKPEVETMLKSAKENKHRDAVRSSLAKGFEFENQHLWKEARAAYYETLQLESDHPDAKEGYTRAGRIIRTLLEFEKLIAEAERKAGKAEFQTAIRDFNKAMSLKPDYLEPADHIAQLRTLLHSQNQPVDVTFHGDGKTWVSITNFRLLGQIEAQTLKILPGDYEVIGRRKGYQDVLLLLQVRNGTPPPSVSVVCRLTNDKS